MSADAIEQETNSLLDCLDILHQLNIRLEDQGYVGDPATKLVAYIAPFNVKADRNERIMLLLRGASGSGKTTAFNIIRRYYPKYNPVTNEGMIMVFHRTTAHAIDYLGGGDPNFTTDGKILMIQQFEGAKDAGYTMMIITDPESGGLKLLTVDMSEGPQKGKTSEIDLKGCPMVVSTSTAIKIDGQQQRRTFYQFPDDSELQTKLIKVHKAKMRKDHVYKKRVKTTDKVLQRIPTKLPVDNVEICFADLIVSKIPDSLLARSDIDKIYNFISAMTRLHFRHRFNYIEDDETFWIASPTDWFYAWEITKNSFELRLGKISDIRLKKTYDLITWYLNEKHESSCRLRDLIPHQKRKGLEWGSARLRQALNELHDKGFLLKDSDPTDKRHTLWSKSSILMERINVSFPDESIEKTYLQFLTEKFSHLNPKNEKVWNNTSFANLYKRSLQVFDINNGRNLTPQVLSPKFKQTIEQ